MKLRNVHLDFNYIKELSWFEATDSIADSVALDDAQSDLEESINSLLTRGVKGAVDNGVWIEVLAP